ncbi:MAG: DUF1538 domain-containing protein [Gammaproteobacteria bacterium]|nr:DUF1538 domain-containing protein [Gammaproteobacteria bacterium]MDH4313941.1 DUF1538 domain-containing protein [Gammaproteobacteria bacterium]MDH5212983.1 DUF1538 domain-containing protein [Gammaproteobacteria bacterium]MDH5502172.1 DUF1538 domain-containing protein [Gammaproteobacteria bacterium]
MDLIGETLLFLARTTVDVLPVAAFLFLFHRLILRRRFTNPGQIAIGFCFVVAGLGVFLLGLEKALFPVGRLMAAQLTELSVSNSGLVPDWADFYLVYLFAFSIGFGTTIAEPALLAVAMKAREVSGGAIQVSALRVVVAIGVAIGVSLGCFRIVTGTPLHWYIAAAYVVVVIQASFAPRLIVPLAFDLGGVTTSTVTVPVIAALGLGLAENVAGRNPLIDGFGLIAFACLFPIITVLAYAQIAVIREARLAKNLSDSQHISAVESEE